MNKMRRTFLILLLLLAVLVSGCAEKTKIDRIEETQKEILTRLDSIESNQKELLKLFKPRRRKAVDYDKVHNIPVGDSPVRGSVDAPVTIVEFSDFQCPYCSRLQSTLEKVLDEFPEQARLVFKDFPLSFHKQAKKAAKAARAAGEQGKYWEMHDLIFKNYSNLSEDKFEEFAKSLGLDMEKFRTDYKSSKYDRDIQADINLGRKIGVSGTPTLFINGKRMKSRSFEAFKTAIERHMKD